MKKNIIWLILCILCFGMCFGCQQSMTVKDPILKHEREYSFNKIYEIPTGSVMVGEGFRFYYKAFRPKGVIFVPNAGIYPKKELRPEDKYLWFGNISTDMVLCRSNYGLKPASICMVADSSGRVTTGWINRVGYSRYVVMVQGEWKERDIFEPIDDIPIIEVEGYQKKDVFYCELIFGGIAKDFIKISYREFKEDLARPAFYQEMVYERGDKIIAFKGLKMEILDVSNQSIRFRIIEGSMVNKK